MDRTARIWDAETGACLHTLKGHGAEIISLQYDACGKHLITGSFDNTVRLWDVRQGRSIREFLGHTGEISSARFNFRVSKAMIVERLISSTPELRNSIYFLCMALSPFLTTAPKTLLLFSLIFALVAPSTK
jgi:WD40 repeat protein